MSTNHNQSGLKLGMTLRDNRLIAVVTLCAVVIIWCMSLLMMTAIPVGNTPLGIALAIMAAGASIAIVLMGVVLASRTSQLASAQRRAEFSARQFREAIEAIPEGFALYDSDDRLVLFNSAYLRIYQASAPVIRAGARFEDILRYGVERGQYVAGIGREEEWVAERLAAHRDPPGPFLQQTQSGQWVRIEERRTADGGVVGIRSDVTEIKQSEFAFFKQATLLSTTMEHLDEGLTVIDSDGVIVTHNKTFCEIFGLPDNIACEGVFLTETLDVFASSYAIQAGSGAHDITALLRRSLANPHEPFEWQSPEGQFIEVRSSPLPDGGSVTTYRDVTQRRAANEKIRLSEAQKSAMLASSLDAVIVCDSYGSIVEFNAAAETIFGYSTAEVIGRPLSEVIVPPELRGAHEAGMARYRETGIKRVIGQRIELTAMRSDGQTFPIEIAIAEIRAENKRFFYAHLRDITESKAAQIDLLRAKDAAEQASRTKSEFLATVSHEVRTPMHGIIGLTDLLLDTRLDNDQRKYLDGISRSANHLLGLVNEILEFARIEAGNLHVEIATFDFLDLIESGLSTTRVLVGNKPVELRAEIADDVPHYVQGDSTRFYQVLQNLLSNSAKFTQRGAIRVRVTSLGSDAGNVALRVEVSDTGPGFSQSVKERLFTPFEQGDASIGQRFGGTGLGLAICSRIIELLDGRIGCESIEGEGSTFWFELTMPVAQDIPQCDLLPAPINETRQPAMRILVAEDTPTSQLVIRAMLAKLGHRVQVVGDGREAVEAVQRGQFDLVILDMQMPEMDGLSAAMEIRRLDGPKASTPLIALTAQAFERDRQRTQEAGFIAHLAKPILLTQLRTALQSVAGKLPRPKQAPAPAVTHQHLLEPFSAAATCEAPPTPIFETDDPSLYALDTEMLDAMRDCMDAEQFSRLLAAGIGDAASILRAAETAMADGDSDALARQSHKLSGLLGQFGLSNLSSAWSDIEAALIEGRQDDASEIRALLEAGHAGLEQLDRLSRAAQ